MNAYTFRRHDSLRGVVNKRTSVARTLSFNGRVIVLSVLLEQEMGIKKGSHVAFTYDEDHPENIYIRTADDADDTKDIQNTVNCISGKIKTLRCTNSAVVRHVLNQVGAKKSCTCYVAPIPTNINGKEHYQILLSCPIKIN